MVLELLRLLLIDYALDKRNELMFRRLTSDSWQEHVISPGKPSQPTHLPQETLLVRKNTTLDR